MDNKLPSVKLLGTSISTSSKEEVLEYILKRLSGPSKKFYIVTPNPEILVYASTSRSYQEILNDASVSLPDGVGVLVSGKILKKGIKSRITGIDLMLELVAECAKRGLSIGLLGGMGGVAEKTSKCLREKYPNLIVNFASDEWDAQITDYRLQIAESKKSEIRNQKSYHIDILFVAFGAPKQEEWIAKNLPSLDVTAAMGVGGAFDYIAGRVPRAPKVVRQVGMEWAFRLLRQPWRARRQLALPVFVAKVLKEKLT